MLNVQIHKVTGSLLEAQKSVPNLVASQNGKNYREPPRL